RPEKRLTHAPALMHGPRPSADKSTPLARAGPGRTRNVNPGGSNTFGAEPPSPERATVARRGACRDLYGLRSRLSPGVDPRRGLVRADLCRDGARAPGSGGPRRRWQQCSSRDAGGRPASDDGLGRVARAPDPQYRRRLPARKTAPRGTDRRFVGRGRVRLDGREPLSPLRARDRSRIRFLSVVWRTDFGRLLTNRG